MDIGWAFLLYKGPLFIALPLFKANGSLLSRQLINSLDDYFNG